jgi:hypothetical protein
MEEWEHSYLPALEQLGQFYKVSMLSTVRSQQQASCMAERFCSREASVKSTASLLMDSLEQPGRFCKVCFLLF